MRPRLEAARELLADDRRDLRQHRRQRGRAPAAAAWTRSSARRNFLAQVVVNLNAKGRQLGNGFATSHEYLLVYAEDARRTVLDASSADTVDERDFPLTDAGRPPLPAPAAAQHQQEVQPDHRAHPALHGLGRPGDAARCARRRSTARRRSARSSATAGRRSGGGAGRSSTSAPTTWSAGAVNGEHGERVDVFQKDWLHPGRRKKLRTIWLAEEIGSTDTAVAELKEIVGHVFESPKPTGLIRRILGDDARRRVRARLLRRQRYDGPRGRAAERRGRRHPALPQHQLRRADPGGVQRPQRRAADRRRHHPGPAAGRRRAGRWWTGRGPDAPGARAQPMSARIDTHASPSSPVDPAASASRPPCGCARPASRCTPSRAAWTGWRRSSEAGITTFAHGRHRRRLDGRPASSGSSPSRGGSTYWSTTPGTAPTARSRTCRSTRRAASSRSTSSAWPGSPSWSRRTCAQQGSGRIINISSIGGKFYEPLGAWYHATKFAVEGFSDSLRIELAPFGIDVVIIEPGPIRTEWNEISRESLTETSRGGAYEEMAEQRPRRSSSAPTRKADVEPPGRGRQEDRQGRDRRQPAGPLPRRPGRRARSCAPAGCCPTAPSTRS